MRVEVDSSEAHGLSMPRRFRMDGRVVEVVKVLDQWFGADYRYCKVKGADGALYILRLDENRYGERDRSLLWSHNTSAFQVGRVSPGLRLMHEAFWCGLSE